MSSPQKNGKDFDTHVNNILKKTNEIIVLDEIEISRKYGNEFRAIDSMIISRSSYGQARLGAAIFLQYKLHKTKISPRDVTYFLMECDGLSKKVNLPYICIYISYEGLSENSIKWVVDYVSKNTNLLNFISINNKNENILIENLVQYLYSLKLNLYEDDGSVIMQDTENDNLKYVIKI